MAILAIKGHATRGKEIIEILKILGGKNDNNCCGYFVDRAYFINGNGYIEGMYAALLPPQYHQVSLERFLEKFPYKVGNKVLYHECKGEIISMKWEEDDVVYSVLCKGTKWETTSNFLQFYTEQKEESMEEPKELLIGFTKDDNEDWVLNTHKDYEIKEFDGKFKLIKKKLQYPKTYEECFKVLYGDIYPNIQVVGIEDSDKYEDFIKLDICKRAYWKIAGEQMELGKLWEPDYTEKSYGQGCPVKYVIYHTGTYITKGQKCTPSHILAFPTEEMRDAFYENFKNLIESVL